ncbi:MAG: hypothetical protein WCF16_13650 [Alphaproteobacteria bacterium]
MIDPRQFRIEIVRKVLGWIDPVVPHSLTAENLLVGTALVESGLRALVQDGGPALGVFQIEPATHHDVLLNFLDYRPALAEQVRAFRAQSPDPDTQLVTNLAYACAIARLIYFRRPEPLPEADDIEALAAYWKAHYNTPQGKGTVTRFVASYRDHGKE